MSLPGNTSFSNYTCKRIYDSLNCIAFAFPAALLRFFRYIFDSRETATGSRLAQVDNDNGAWGCKTMWWCTDVCPKGIPVTKCLGQIKRLIKEKEKG
jgi:succinate dehydrogenase / fumarate reductase iron-sulfur subunit